MGKTTKTRNSSVPPKEKTNTGTLKPSSSNSSIQRKKKSRSCSTTRRLSVTANSSDIVPSNANGNQKQINPQGDTSDDGEDFDG